MPAGGVRTLHWHLLACAVKEHGQGVQRQQLRVVPFHASITGSKGRSKISRKDSTNASPPMLLAPEVESRADMVKLARTPAVMIDRAPPVATVADEHVLLGNTSVCANACDLSCSALRKHARPNANRKLERCFISRWQHHHKRTGRSRGSRSHR